MYCNCHYRNNPITPHHLTKVLTLAIWPNTEIHEAEAARKMSVRFLTAVKELDLTKLKAVITEVMQGPAKKAGAMAKLKIIYEEARKTNKLLPTIEALTGLKTSSSSRKSKISSRVGKTSARTPKPSGRSAKAPPPKAASKPGAKPPPKAASSSKTGPKPSSKPTSKPTSKPRAPEPPPRRPEACRRCDGRGYTIKVDKENVLKETKIPCSACGGGGKEPPPSSGKKGGRWFRRPAEDEDEENKDANKAADYFLRKHGYGKWGQKDV